MTILIYKLLSNIVQTKPTNNTQNIQKVIIVKTKTLAY